MARAPAAFIASSRGVLGLLGASTRAIFDLARPRLPSRHALIVSGITAFAGALRFARLGSQSYWFDEASTVELVRRSLTDMLAAIPGGESTPPLYYVLAWTWAKFFGTGEASLRSLSAVLGTAVIPTSYAAAKELVSARTGLIAAGLAATSPYLVWYSQEARAYELLVLLSALSLLFFARALRSATAANYGVWALFSALALATHYFAIFVIVPESLLLLGQRDRRRRSAFAVAGVLATAFALLPLAIHQARTKNATWISDTSLAHRLNELVREFISGRYEPGHTRLLVGILALGMLASIALCRGREQRGAVVALTVGAVALLTPLFLIPLGADFLFHRNLIVAWIPLSIALAAGMGASRAHDVGLAVAGAACAFGLYSTLFIARHPAVQRTDWRGAAQALPAVDGAREIVVWPPEEALTVRLYRPDAQSALSNRADVSEVGVLIRNARPALITPPPGFREVERREVQNVAVALFRSPRPRVLWRAKLVRELRAPASATLLRER